MTLYSRGNARRSLVDTVALRAVSQISTLLGYVVFVRGMSEEDLGIFSLLYAFVPVVSTVASLGLEQVLRRYQPEYLRSGNWAAAAWLVRVIASTRLVANILVLGLILLGWSYIAPIFNVTSHRAAFAAFSLVILLLFQTSILQTALGSHMLHRHAVGATTLMSIIKLTVYCVLTLYDALSLEAAIATETLAYGAGYVWLRVAYRLKCLSGETGRGYRPEPAERSRLFRYALLNNFNDAGVLLIYGTLDSFFLAAFVGTTAVGIYSFYNRLKLMVSSVLPVRLFDNVIRPLFFSVPAAEADRKIPLYFSFLLNMSLLVQWPALAFSIAYHAEIVQAVFGGKFIADSWLLPMVMAFGLLNSISEPATLVAQYDERAGTLLLSKLFAVYNLVAMAALVPLIGIYGAALAAGTAQLMKNAFVWWRVRRRAVWTNGSVMVPISLGLWSAGTAACFGLKTLVDLPPVVDLIIGLVVFACVGAIFLRSAAISSTDRAILAALVPGKAMRALRYLGI
jgi:O-antigen/teichoic acid export membrane protein